MSTQQKTQDIFDSWGTFITSFQEQNERVTRSFLEGMNRALPFPPTMIGDVFIKASQSLIENPDALLKAHKNLTQEINGLWEKMLANENEEIQETPSDKRFHHEAWQTVPYFKFMKDYYLTTSKWLGDLVSQAEGLDPDTASKVQFYTKQIIEAMAPTNFPMTNPEVLEEIIKTQGESLRNGFETLLADLKSGEGMKLTDPTKFEVGKTIACTKGDVIFRNELFELIHYAPLTKEQYAVPLLIIPPWINKYYIFDLSPDNSYVKWMLEQGHNVYIISWVNPGSELAKKSFEDYLFEGAYRAADIITTLTKSPKLHGVGFCVGGNLLTALAAYLAKANAPFSLASMTTLATIFDFSKVGDLKIFMDNEHLSCLEDSMDEKGFLDSETLKSFFNMLRPKDLIWSFFIKNYLLGKVPPPFDFLYWNSDSTRLPASLHKYVCRKLFHENLLIKPGGLQVKGTPLDLRQIKTPTFILSTIDDHIAPWKSSYPATHLFQGPLKFILATSGHVAGVMNPPSKNKYAFYENLNYPQNPDKWLEAASQTTGSWWTAWQEWIAPLSGERTSTVGSYYSLEPAPGSYVKEK